MEEIRSDRDQRIVLNPWDESGRGVHANELTYSLTDVGGIASDHVAQQKACYCGCLNPPGGFCADCHQLICVQCYHRCEAPGCGRPLGPCCSISSRAPTGAIIHLCRRCHAAARRKGLLRLLLSPFVRFEE